jgi:hypothetical protein
MSEPTTPPRGSGPTFAGQNPPSFGGAHGRRYVPVVALSEPRYDADGTLLREVWKYRDVESERDVAVKLIPTAGRGELVAQVERGGAALAADVPGVAVLLDHLLIGERGGDERLALISQFVLGIRLDSLEPSRPERALQLARSLATSVAALHAGGVVHGDIKPSNVIVRTSDGQPILIDAGSARRTGQRLLASTRLWEPPEAGLDPSATTEYDCWSLGLVLAALPGFQPEPGETPQERGARACRETSGPLEATVAALLRPDPQARASAKDACAQLGAWRPQARRRSRRWLIASAIACLAIVAGGVEAVAALTSGGAHATTAPRLEVFNKLVFGAKGIREDTTPAALSTLHRIRCQKLGCNVAGTERHTGGTLPPPVCQAQGDLVTNGSLSDPSDDHNPALVTSTRWYGVPGPHTPTDLDYINEVWVQPSERGGLGLPTCDSWLARHD